MLLRTAPPAPKEVDLTRTYDAIVVGSGAAGGMAAHVLTDARPRGAACSRRARSSTSRRSCSSMEWPYDHPRRGEMPYDRHALTLNEYTIRQPPYAPRTALRQGLLLRAELERDRLLEEHRGEREGPSLHRARSTPGCGRAAWAARRTSGAGWPCASPTTTSRPRAATATAKTGRSPTPTCAPYYDKVDLYLGISGHAEGLEHLPDSMFQRPTRLNGAEVKLRESMKRAEPGAHAVPRGRHHGRPEAQQVPQPLLRPRRLQPRAGGCDIHAAFDSPTGLIYPARTRGSLTLRTNAVVREVTVDPATGKASRRGLLDAETRKELRGEGQGRDPGRLHPRVHPHPAAVALRRCIRTGSATPAATSATTSAST